MQKAAFIEVVYIWLKFFWLKFCYKTTQEQAYGQKGPTLYL